MLLHDSINGGGGGKCSINFFLSTAFATHKYDLSSYVANMQRIRTKRLSARMQSSSFLRLPNSTECALRKEELREAPTGSEVFTV